MPKTSCKVRLFYKHSHRVPLKKILISGIKKSFTHFSFILVSTAMRLVKFILWREATKRLAGFKRKNLSKFQLLESIRMLFTFNIVNVGMKDPKITCSREKINEEVKHLAMLSFRDYEKKKNEK